MNTHSFFSRLCHSPIPRVAAVTLVALAWSSLAFCGEVHDAAAGGDLGKVKAPLKDNPDLVFSKDNGDTLLHWAARNGQKDVAELLLANKADVNAKDNNGATPLHRAMANTALHIAARFAYKDFVEFLLANGANVNAIQDVGWTPLHHAALGGNKDIVEMLLAKGADANAKDKDGKTPSIVARDEGYTDIAELLKKRQDKNPPKTAFVPPEALKRGLVLYFDFDTNPVAGKIPDLSGQGNNGKPVGVQWVADGHSGGSVGDGNKAIARLKPLKFFETDSHASHRN
jgi:ankyrin repeat protein